MARVSVGEALGEGVRLIVRRPLVIVAWGLVFLVVGLLPSLAAAAYLAPDVINLFQHPLPPAGGIPPGMLAIQSKMLLLQPVIFLTSMLARGVMAGAVFRAVLQPADDRFAYLRVGPAELWLSVLFVAMAILAAMIMFAVMIPAVLIGVIGAVVLHGGQAGGTMAVAVFLCAGIVMAGVLVWLGLRMSMAAPMTFAAREFRLFESWTLTKGHALKLFQLALVQGVILVAIGVAIDVALVFGILGLVGHWDAARLQSFVQQPPAVLVRIIAPWAAVLGVLGCTVGAAVGAFILAPWASVYRQLTGGPPPSPAAASTAGQAPAV